MSDQNSTEYINSTDYKTLSEKMKELQDVLDDLRDKSTASRRLRYADVDVEAERLAGRLQPDELYIPQHIIDTNIRREQSAYVQYITQSPRAVILEDDLDPSIDLSLLERDLTKKLRFDGWQLSQFANIDGFQANGYGVMELIYDTTTQGGVSHEAIQYGDFAFISDTRDIQAVEMTARSYYFTRTRLLELCGNPENPKPDTDWNKDQVEKVITGNPAATNTNWDTNDYSDKASLFRVTKVMFRVNGIVQVAWTQQVICDDWLRKPRPLYIGRRKAVDTSQMQLPSTLPGQQSPPGNNTVLGATNPMQQQQQMQQMIQQQFPNGIEQYETEYPYFLFPYLISENDTIAHLQGRVKLDQDMQEATTSLMSSTCTQSRRAAGLYFSRDTGDPNDDVLMEKNIFFKSGCIINGKISQYQLSAPDPSIFSAIQMLVSSNQNETSQVNFAVNNRKDSRKTAKEIDVASQQATILSTVQVVLFSLALKKLYTTMISVIKSRVQFGLINVNPQARPLYDRSFSVKPAGDVDVIEKQQLVQTMMSSWPVIQNTPASVPFLSDMIEMMFPVNAAKYLKAFAQAQQQAQSQQAQQMQQGMALLQQLAGGIIKLSKHPEYFSETGRIHAFPLVETSAEQLEAMEKQMKQSQQQQPVQGKK